MIVKIVPFVSLLWYLLTTAGLALANEENIKRGLSARLPGMAVESVTRSPFAGLYEVVLDGEIVYTDEKMEYFFSGNVFDIRAMPPRNLTEGNAQRATVGVLAKAGRDFAIKRVRGNGKRVLYTFEDPNCGYCKALHQEFERLDNVTIYTFPTPMLSQNSADKAVAAWCAEDRAGAWDKLMAGGELPAGATACPHPLASVAALAKRFEVRSTPVIFLGDGRRINGFVSADNLEKAFDAEK
jgi:thiol:disulfide interchange protein DsbC